MYLRQRHNESAKMKDSESTAALSIEALTKELVEKKKLGKE